MIYLSELLNKPVYFQDRKFGKLLDMAVSENRPVPPVSKILIKKDGRKISVTPMAVKIEKEKIVLSNVKVPLLPYDEQDFYLNEDLLDKQVIDIDGKRLVRVNDVVLESNGEIKVMGIDVGTSGIMRRLGLGWLIKLKSKVLPWTIIEAFDYQTGAVKLRLSQNRLDMFHPSEIAEILEQLGSKERLGIVETLDAKKAARAIEELDSQAQVSILEHLPKSPFKDIVNKMHLSEIADIFHRLNRPTSTRVENVLGEEKTTRLQRLFKFSDNVAGGLMETAFFRENGDKTAKELLRTLREKNLRPETVVVTNGNDKLIGIAYSRDLLNADPLEQIRDLVLHRMFVYPFADFPKILKLFSQYNLRALPVVNKEKQPIGVITIDKIMQMIQEEEEEKNEIL